MRSKARRIGLERTGSVQVLAGGLVLFLSGTMLGGYVVWSQLKGQQEPDIRVYNETQTAGWEQQSSNEIPHAHAFGSKSDLIFEPRTTPRPNMAPSTKWKPILSPSDITPPTASHVGTKSFMPITPSDFKGVNASKGGGQPTASPLPDPPPMLFGTKSAPVFRPRDLNSNKVPSQFSSPATNLPAPAPRVRAPQRAYPAQTTHDWRSSNRPPSLNQNSESK